MSDSLSLPGQPQQPTNLPGNPQFFVFQGFETLNTKPQRPAIGDQQMSICDNFQPIGPNNLRALWDVGSAIYTATTGNSISQFYFDNIADTAFCTAFESDGKIVQITTSSLGTTTIASAGTITTPANQIGLAQFGNQYVLVTAPQSNGYFIWDGQLLYQAGTAGPTVTISNGGLDYTSPPTITAIGGTGTTVATYSAAISNGAVNTITVQSVGSGYSNGDVIYLAFTGGSSKASATAVASISAGTVGFISSLSAGTGYSPATVKVALQGGGGFGATAHAVMGNSGGGLLQVVVDNPGLGYVTAPTVVFTDTNNPVAQATASTMPFGIQGTAIETYSNRVWVANGAAPTNVPSKSRIIFSAASAPADFSINDAAGAFLSTDSFLRVGAHQLKQSNGFLYLVADSSVNYISGVQVSGNPPTTTFSNQNVDPQIGSPWPNTVQVFSRSIVFANTFGIHAMYGGSVQKVSNELDGIYTTVSSTGTVPQINGLTPSSAVTIINGIHCYMLLLPIVDQVTGKTVNKLLIWDGKRWFTAQPSVTLTQIASQEINSVLTAYGTDGTSIYPLFNMSSAKITKTVQSKQWDNPSIFWQKRAQRIGGVLKSLGTANATVNITIDTELGSDKVQAVDQNTVTWVNNQSQIVAWTNNASQAVTWVNPQTGIFVLPCDVTGSLMGMTLNSTTPDFVLEKLSLFTQEYVSLI